MVYSPEGAAFLSPPKEETAEQIRLRGYTDMSNPYGQNKP